MRYVPGLAIPVCSTVATWLLLPGAFAWYMSGLNTATVILVMTVAICDRRRRDLADAADELRRQRELREDWRRRF